MKIKPNVPSVGVTRKGINSQRRHTHGLTSDFNITGLHVTMILFFIASVALLARRVNRLFLSYLVPRFQNSSSLKTFHMEKSLIYTKMNL